MLQLLRLGLWTFLVDRGHSWRVHCLLEQPLLSIDVVPSAVRVGCCTSCGHLGGILLHWGLSLLLVLLVAGILPWSSGLYRSCTSNLIEKGSIVRQERLRTILLLAEAIQGI